MPASNAPLPVPYLSDTDFITGQEAWKELVQAGDSDQLAQAFAWPDGEESARVGGFSFPIESIKQLLSAVAVRTIQVHFVLLPEGRKFAAVFSALDAEGKPLTAYYGPGQPTSAPSLAPVSAESRNAASLAIPPVLAADWAANWQALSPLTREMFISADHPLEGYKFEVESVVQALFAASSGETIQLLLGAHQYYGPGYDGTPTAKFGVVLASLAGASNEIEDTFFDMCMPCPPY